MSVLRGRIVQLIDLPAAFCEITVQGQNNVMTVDLGWQGQITLMLSLSSLHSES